MKLIIDKQYDIVPETNTFIISGNQYISFTMVFKYLGSLLSYYLDDTYDISARIKKTNQAMGALRFFWISENVDLHAKYLIYMTAPPNFIF